MLLCFQGSPFGTAVAGDHPSHMHDPCSHNPILRLRCSG